MSGGKAIEHLAKQGNKLHFDIKPPMQHAKNCDFSFSGLQHVVDRLITQKEKEEGIFRIGQVGKISNPGLCLKLAAYFRRDPQGANPVFSCTHRRCSAAHSSVPHCKKNSPRHSVLQAETVVISK